MEQAIGIFGGTFNPIHNAHIEVAMSAYKECNLSKVIFLPNGNPPHKAGEKIADKIHRLNMIKLAIKDYDMFEVSDYELNRTEPSYTIDTNRHFKTLYSCPVYFIIGADSLFTLSEWRNYETLKKECFFIVADRVYSEDYDIKKYCDNYNKSGGTVKLLTMSKYDVSSTDIRQSVEADEKIKTLIPQSVLNYIKEHNVY